VHDGPDAIGFAEAGPHRQRAILRNLGTHHSGENAAGRELVTEAIDDQPIHADGEGVTPQQGSADRMGNKKAAAIAAARG
jgi:hypothetical protein